MKRVTVDKCATDVTPATAVETLPAVQHSLIIDQRQLSRGQPSDCHQHTRANYRLPLQLLEPFVYRYSWQLLQSYLGKVFFYTI